jgi:hypothetical protein
LEAAAGCPLAVDARCRFDAQPFDHLPEEINVDARTTASSRSRCRALAGASPAEMPRDVWNLVTFKALRNNKTEMTRMMEMSRIGLEQCLDKMTASFAKAREDRLLLEQVRTIS